MGVSLLPVLAELELIFAEFLVDQRKKVVDHSRHQSRGVLGSLHREGLARACLAKREDTDIESI